MIYLDSNASYPINKDILQKSIELLKDGNPSSVHSAGSKAREQIESARASIAKSINCEPEEIVFTSGGTEANNLALNTYVRCGADYSLYPTIKASNIEHSSVYEYLLRNGKPTAYLPVDNKGFVDLEYLEKILEKEYKYQSNDDRIDPQCGLVVAMLANNETGVLIDPTNELRFVCEKYKAKLHIDAVQAYGKQKIDVKELGCDTMTISAHKVGGLQGIGCLFVKNKTVLWPIIGGGEHELGRRAGTENQLGIINFGMLARKIHLSFNVVEYVYGSSNIYDLRNELENQLVNVYEIAKINGDQEYRVSNTSNLYFSSIPDSEIFVSELSDAGLCVSGGSACNSGLHAPSRVLQAMYGKDSDRAKKSIRFSLSEYTTKDEIDQSVNIIRKVLNKF